MMRRLFPAVFAGSAAAASAPVCPAGVFELTDASGNPAGLIEAMLRWKSTYLPPSGSTSTAGEPTGSKSVAADQAEEELHRWPDEGTDEEWAKGDAAQVSPPQPDEAAPQVITDDSSSTLRSRRRGS